MNNITVDVIDSFNKNFFKNKRNNQRKKSNELTKSQDFKTIFQNKIAKNNELSAKY